ncbi:MAG: tRNA uridine-5-carboxymethylaminomethyl(34) synthesis GTPase MnmE [Desulfovibrionaceae bacterium]|nr:tRNA uridine-5-carboxymethylaminomethyl(34) synthesis GTPase MnmE [Desulfovibrionaceae bacterium]
MPSPSSKDTIAAVATPPGSGALGIVRLSGARASALARAMFRSLRPSFSGFRPYRLHHGQVLDAQGRVLDEVLAAFMPGPNSYTGEDCFEFHCHGGRAVVAVVLAAALDRGARQARPGEFTLRAFLNGRLDLTQAEAVAEAISAPGQAALRLAQIKLSGALGQRIRELKALLQDLRAKLCLAVDFPDDEAECLSRAELARDCGLVREALGRLLAGVRRGRAWRQGALAVLLGRVNAGKSSLLNALLGRERAIVAEAPGTTRDYLEETLDLGGALVRVADTAGLGDPGDEVERAGLELGRELAGRADLVLLVCDRSRPLSGEDVEAAREFGPQRILAAANKSDLAPASPDPLAGLAALGLEALPISARTGAGIEELCAGLRRRILDGRDGPCEDEPVPNDRQARALGRADAELAALELDNRQEATYDVMGVRLEAACAILSEVTGELTSKDVLDDIFSRFCIGK